MVKRRRINERPCIDCGEPVYREHPVGPIRKRCPPCLRRAAAQAQYRYRARNPEWLIAHAEGERRRRRERDGLPADYVY